jgi:urease accessory protein
MLFGFSAAGLGLQVPFVEPAIAASILILGSSVAFALKMPAWAGGMLVAFFAFFHGHAHGSESAGLSAIPFAAGFALATAALHTSGVGVAQIAGASVGKPVMRFIGGAIAICGAFAAVGA